MESKDRIMNFSTKTIYVCPECGIENDGDRTECHNCGFGQNMCPTCGAYKTIEEPSSGPCKECLELCPDLDEHEVRLGDALNVLDDFTLDELLQYTVALNGITEVVAVLSMLMPEPYKNVLRKTLSVVERPQHHKLVVQLKESLFS
jgi:hypothetical protein